MYSILHNPTRVMFNAYFNLRTIGRENVPAEGPVLALSNHQSFLDPPLCGAGLRRELDYMARKSLFRNPLFGWFIRSLNAFPVEPGSSDIKAIKDIINRLKSGRAVLMFPEATRTEDGRIRTIKSGFELIARRSKATVVPVVIDGAFEAWPRHQKLPGMGRIWVWYGEPFTPEQVKTLGRDEFVAQINQRLRTMQTQLRHRLGKKPYQYD